MSLVANNTRGMSLHTDSLASFSLSVKGVCAMNTSDLVSCVATFFVGWNTIRAGVSGLFLVIFQVEEEILCPVKIVIF